jgi:hypothetical protein
LAGISNPPQACAKARPARDVAVQQRDTCKNSVESKQDE